MLEYLNQNSGAFSVIFTAVVTVSTVVYAILTAVLVNETRRMRQAQTEPKVEIVLRPREEWINLIRLHVKNIGLGPAYDISIKASAVTDGEGAKALINDFTSANFFKTGLRYLGPGQEIVSGYTQMIDNYSAKIESVLHFAVTYKDSIGKTYSEIFPVDFSEFKGRTQVGTPHLYTIAKSIEKIEKYLDNISSGWKKIKVDIYDQTDRDREKKEWEDYREEMLQSNSQSTKQDS